MPMCPCGQCDLSVDETQWSVHSHLSSSPATNTAGQFLWCSGASVFPRSDTAGQGAPPGVSGAEMENQSTLASSEDSPRNLLGRATGVWSPRWRGLALDLAA